MTDPQALKAAFDKLGAHQQSQFIYNLVLNYLEIFDPKKRQQVLDAIPIALKMLDHLVENKHFFETMAADWALIAPAVQTVLNAWRAKQ